MLGHTVVSNGPLEGSTMQYRWTPRLERAGTPALVYLHGGGGTVAQVHAQDEVPRMAVKDGWTVYSVLAGGTDAWATDASVATLHTTITTLLASHSSVALYGLSMGAATALRYEKAHPNVASGVIVSVPAVDLEFLAINANSPLTSAPLLAAWGGQAAWDAVKATVNPARHPQYFGRIQLWYSETDQLFGTSPGFVNTITTFARGARIKAHSLGSVEHNPTNHDPDIVLGYLERSL